MKEKTPGVGSSIGLDRLMAALGETGSPLLANQSYADILIIPSQGKEAEAFSAAARLRAEGIRTDMYLNPDAKMKKIYAYAETGHIPYMMTFSDDGFSVKDLRTRETMTGEAAIERIREESRH